MLQKTKYPIFILSKGRAKTCLTAQAFIAEGFTDFYLVVEPQDHEEYKKEMPQIKIEVLPYDNQGIVYVRNYIKEISQMNGDEKHWAIDDNISGMLKVVKENGKRKLVKTNFIEALKVCEEFVDRYENIGAAGISHQNFGLTKEKPFYLNQQVYSCALISNLDGFWYRDSVEDTDYSLQILMSGLCTVLFNIFLIKKAPTMKMKGGNTEITYGGDGRLLRAKKLKAYWPKLIDYTIKDGKVKVLSSHIWRKFEQRLIKKDV